jgi:predicted DNA binding protein
LIPYNNIIKKYKKINKMKNLILTLVFAVALTFGVNSINSSELSSKSLSSTQAADSNNDGYIYIRVYEDGAIWVYVYSEDGAFISKHIENQ